MADKSTKNSDCKTFFSQNRNIYRRQINVDIYDQYQPSYNIENYDSVEKVFDDKIAYTIHKRAKFDFDLKNSLRKMEHGKSNFVINSKKKNCYK